MAPTDGPLVAIVDDDEFLRRWIERAARALSWVQKRDVRFGRRFPRTLRFEPNRGTMRGQFLW